MSDLVPLQLQDSVKKPEGRSFIHELLGQSLINMDDGFFKDQKILIDGYRFYNCRFEDCKLVSLRGTFEFHRCVFPRTSRVYGEEALKCLQLTLVGWEGVEALKDSYAEGCFPKINSDGSYTIAKGISFS